MGHRTKPLDLACADADFVLRWLKQTPTPPETIIALQERVVRILEASTDERKHGPVHHLHAGRYVAVVRDAVPMIERSDMLGAVLAVECVCGRYLPCECPGVPEDSKCFGSNKGLQL